MSIIVTARQTAESRAEQSKAGAVFYVSVIPISVWTALLRSAPRYLSDHTNRNNTNIKHRASFALLSPALLLFVWTRPKMIIFL